MTDRPNAELQVTLEPQRWAQSEAVMWQWDGVIGGVWRQRRHTWRVKDRGGRSVTHDRFSQQSVIRIVSALRSEERVSEKVIARHSWSRKRKRRQRKMYYTIIRCLFFLGKHRNIQYCSSCNTNSKALSKELCIKKKICVNTSNSMYWFFVGYAPLLTILQNP